MADNRWSWPGVGLCVRIPFCRPAIPFLPSPFAGLSAPGARQGCAGVPADRLGSFRPGLADMRCRESVILILILSHCFDTSF